MLSKLLVSRVTYCDAAFDPMIYCLGQRFEREQWMGSSGRYNKMEFNVNMTFFEPRPTLCLHPGESSPQDFAQRLCYVCNT